MKKTIYIVIRVTRFTVLPVAAFNSFCNAETYLKEKEAYDKKYRGYIHEIEVKDME